MGLVREWAKGGRQVPEGPACIVRRGCYGYRPAGSTGLIRWGGGCSARENVVFRSDWNARTGQTGRGRRRRRPRRLRAELRALAPTYLVVGARRVEDSPLLEEERDIMRTAKAQRRREFASGRALLRQLIGRNVPIPVGHNRAPVLPADIRGSLSHDAAFVVAAITRHAGVLSIGIDIEPVKAIEEDLRSIVLRPDEEQLDAGLAFTLKEAAYKAWSNLGGRMLDFHDMRIATSGSAFWAEVVADGRVLSGSFGTAANRRIALVVVERSPHRS